MNFGRLYALRVSPVSDTLQQVLAGLGDQPVPSGIRAAKAEIDRATADLRPVRVAVGATYTTDLFQPYLAWALAGRGLHLSWTPVPYNQIYPQLITPDAPLKTGGVDVAVVLPRIEELFAEAWNHLPNDSRGARAAATAELDALVSAVATFLGDYAGLLLIGNFVRPNPLPLGLMDAGSPAGGAAFCEWLNLEWRDRLAQFPTVRVIDVAGTLAAHGAIATSDPTRWYLGRIPFKEIAFLAIAALIARYAAAWLLPAKKVAVLDCDGVLWGGVAGEDGPAGVLLGDTAPGNAYADFQRCFQRLHDRGFLLALCSKNDANAVWEVFDQNAAMALTRKHIAATRINWSSKSANCIEIAQELNVGVDSLVLIDDNPAECAEVRAHLPQVAVIQLPDDAAQFVSVVEDSGFFDRLTLTAEDRNRQRCYADEGRRQQLRSAMTPDDYLASLAMNVEVFRPLPSDLPRVAQLINKTNQFNLTTRRRTEGEVVSLAGDPRMAIYAVRVSDRFGDYGVTGAAIVARDGDRAWIDTFLLSCRALARGVEQALLARIVADCTSGGVRMLSARFIPTAKNTAARGFLEQGGFAATDGDGWQSLAISSSQVHSFDHAAR